MDRGRVKDFSLFSDILREVGIIEHTDPSQEQIDPALLEAMEESKDPREAPDSVLAQPIDTIIQAPARRVRASWWSSRTIRPTSPA